MSFGFIKLSIWPFVIAFIALFDYDAHANRIKIDPTIPLSQQLVYDNVTYVINSDCYVNRILNNKEIICNNPVDIVRGEFDFTCSEAINIDNTTYYITPVQIRIYWNEALYLPKGCVIIDSQKKHILSREAIYRNPSEYTAYIGCEKKMKSRYQHCKVYYYNDEPIELKEDEGLISTDDCVILDKKKHLIKSYQTCYIPERMEEVYIAKREKGKVSYNVLNVLALPKNITLNVKKGQIKNGILKCNGLQIVDSGKKLFSNVVLLGDVSNKCLRVEWFGCSVRNDGRDNYEIVSKYVLPSALFTHSNIYHSKKGTYDFTGGYPIKNYHWGYDHTYIMDCHGIEVFGTGPQTIIRGVPTAGDNPADVFNFVDLSNITVRDLSVTAIEGNGRKTHGTNAFSLCQSIDNIVIERTRAYNLPIVHMQSYPDGGKGYTIQVESGSFQINVLIKDNIAKNVAGGFDYSRTSKANNDYRSNIRFINNRVQNAIVGCVIHEEVSPNRDEKESILVKGNVFKNCQVGIYCMLVKALIISDNKFIKNRSVPLAKYYNDYYGILITGAFNTKIENNDFMLNDCKSFIYVTQYSFYPVWHGEISCLEIDGVKTKGKSRGPVVDIAPDAKTVEQKKFFKNVNIRNINN